MRSRTVTPWCIVFVAVLSIVLAAGAGSSQPAKGAPTELRVLVFGGTLGKGFYEAVKGFEQEFNAKLVLTDSTSIQGLTRLLARKGQEPEWDVTHMSPSAHFMGVQAGVLEPLTPDKVPNAKDLIPFARDDRYLGWGVLAFGLEVNTAALKKAGVPEPQGWADLWKPVYKRRVVVNDFANAYGQAFFDIVTQLSGGEEQAWAKLRELRPNMVGFPFTPAELDNMLLQGDAWVAVNSDSRSNLLIKKGAPIKFIYPAEGAAAWLVHIDIPKGTPKLDLAYKFINYVIDPKVQAKVAVSAQVGPVNKHTKLTEQEAQGLAYGGDLGKMRSLHWDQVVPNVQRLTDRWNREFGK